MSTETRLSNPGEKDPILCFKFSNPHGEIYASVQSELFQNEGGWSDYVKVGFAACDPHDRGIKRKLRWYHGRGRSTKRLESDPIRIGLLERFEYSESEPQNDERRLYELLERSLMNYLRRAGETGFPEAWLGLQTHENPEKSSFRKWYSKFCLEFKGRRI